MDRLVGVEGYGYEEPRIHKILGGIFYVICCKRIHMMDQSSFINIVSFYSQVASVIAEDDDVTNAFPLFRAVEHLV